MIYFAGPDYPHVVKIGWTRCLAGRIADLQIYCPLPIFGRGWTDGEFQEEQAMHRRFEEHHVKGEWFQFDGPIQDYIRDHCYEWNEDDFPAKERQKPPHKGSKILIGCDADFKVIWMNFAFDLNLSYAKVLDLATASYATDRGFRPPPPFPEADKPLLMRNKTTTTGYGIMIKANNEWVRWIAEFAKWDGRHSVSPMARHAIKQLKENSPVVC